MWNPGNPTRSFLALSMAAAVAFLGGAVVLKGGRSLPAFAPGQAGAGRGILLLAVVILLSLTGVVLLAVAAATLLDRQRSQPR